MLIAQLTEENRILVVFDTDRHIDPGVEGVELPPSVFDEITQTGKFGDWRYENGQFVNDPEVLPNPPTTTRPTGEIPRSIL